MEAVVIAGIEVNMGTASMRNMIEGGAAGLLLLLTILHFFFKPGGSAFFAVHIGWGIWAWIGLILAVVIAYGGFMRWQEAAVTTPAPPPPAAGGGYAP